MTRGLPVWPDPPWECALLPACVWVGGHSGTRPLLPIRGDADLILSAGAKALGCGRFRAGVPITYWKEDQRGIREKRHGWVEKWESGRGCEVFFQDPREGTNAYGVSLCLSSV